MPGHTPHSPQDRWIGYLTTFNLCFHHPVSFPVQHLPGGGTLRIEIGHGSILARFSILCQIFLKTAGEFHQSAQWRFNDAPTPYRHHLGLAVSIEICKYRSMYLYLMKGNLK
jgi:hypothetical protein